MDRKAEFSLDRQPSKPSDFVYLPVNARGKEKNINDFKNIFDILEIPYLPPPINEHQQIHAITDPQDQPKESSNHENNYGEDPDEALYFS
ncbi:hypothetical protein MXB_376, partial [Myxobolus squamalis]